MLSRVFAGWIVATLVLAGCAKPPPAPPPAAPPGPHAADLPQVGRFAGVLPCSGCDGVRTELLLAGNWDGLQLYHLRETYLGAAQGTRTVEREGAWVKLRGVPENEQATVYQLDPDRPGQRRHFIVVDDRTIRLLDDALEPIGEPLVRVDAR
ncbi:MAG TPA: copper resistance protein NlpE N-terminal domain-containing protein [Candidatus Dormibacteraeota bacterium]|nr:copper resistance protein NlpE N-terminal domain-containing protein [Candidatus Dormibacteraeota bacterium]